jgi:hypothetical protein
MRRKNLYREICDRVGSIFLNLFTAHGTIMVNPLSFCFISAILFLGSCQDDCPNITCTESNTVIAPSAIKDYFVFKKGSYWIYRNTVTSERDCVYVHEFRRQVYQPSDNEVCVSKCYEDFFQSVYSVKYGRSNLQVRALPRESKDSNQEIFCVNETDYSVDVHYPVIRFYSIGTSYHNLLSSGAEWTYLDSMMINGKTYYNVQKFQYGSTFDKDDYLRSASYAKHTGMIRFKRKDGTEWELVEYYISPD